MQFIVYKNGFSRLDIGPLMVALFVVVIRRQVCRICFDIIGIDDFPAVTVSDLTAAVTVVRL
jgi:hypothetical protein